MLCLVLLLVKTSQGSSLNALLGIGSLGAQLERRRKNGRRPARQQQCDKLKNRSRSPLKSEKGAN